MILPAQTIRLLAQTINLIDPFEERGEIHGMTYGLSPATYDCRINQDIFIKPHEFILASTLERVTLPNDLRATVCDKSSWARRGLAVQNTKIDPGFCGHITLELTNHSSLPLVIEVGMPIMQLEFARLEAPTEMIYQGKYQNQPNRPVPFRKGSGPWQSK